MIDKLHITGFMRDKVSFLEAVARESAASVHYRLIPRRCQLAIIVTADTVLTYIGTRSD